MAGSAAMTMPLRQFDVLIFHHDGRYEELLVERLQKLLLELPVGEEIKIASTSEHFTTGSKFHSMEDALERCSWMFILITKDLLEDPMGVFQNNQALSHSIYDKGNEKYVPIYENRDEMRSLNVKSYIKMLNGFNIEEMSSSKLKRTGLVNTIKSKLVARKDREKQERNRCQIENLLAAFKARIDAMKHEFLVKKAKLQGEAEVDMLRRHYASQICNLARQEGIEDPDEFLDRHRVDVSFVTASSGTSPGYPSGKFNSLTSMDLTFSLYESGDQVHRVDNGLPATGAAGGREPVEHDDCVEMSEEETAHPPPYQSREFQQVPQLNNEHMMDDLKSRIQMPPPEQRPENIGRASPLTVPPCDNPQPLIPTVIDDLSTLTTYNSVLRSLSRPDRDDDSLIVECESVRDTPSLLGSQSHANLADVEDDLVEKESRFSDYSIGDTDMDTEETSLQSQHQVDLSLLDLATGARPLPLERLAARHRDTDDDTSMVVEVNSAAEEDIETPTTEQPVMSQQTSPFKQPAEPPLRVMHRSFCPDDDDEDFDVEPLEIDVESLGGDGDGAMSPGLGEIAAYSWPRPRRGSDTGRRPIRTNLNTQRFLSLSSIQSLSSKLSMMRQHPSLNNISDMRERPRLLDGIRNRYAW